VILTRTKQNILERQGIDEYLALCLSSGERLRYSTKRLALDCTPEALKYELGHLSDAGDALKLSQSLRESGHLDESLEVGERCLKLGGSKASLDEMGKLNSL
jgi:hypothetical protein